MSYVTSAVIFVGYASPEVRERLTEPQSFGRTDAVHMQAFGKLDDNAAGGSKYLEVDVYAAGLNHIDPDALDDWFLGLPWGDGSAVLIYSVEGNRGTIVRTPGWERGESVAD